MTLRQLPTVLVLAVAALGLLMAALVDWESGSVVLGLALLLAAGLRLTLPARQVGLLAVRSRGLDAAILLALGFALVLLARSIPDV